jgi:arsenite oxidase small subunit
MNRGRRDFLKTAVVAGLALAVAGVTAVAKSITEPATPPSYGGGTVTPATTFPHVKVASLGSIAVNTPVYFNYPLDDEPNILVKLGTKAEGGVGPDGDIVAFSQLCQHLGCQIGYQATGSSPKCNSSYRAEGPVGYCCCHGSIYDLVNGAKVVGGPAPLPQPKVELEVDSSGDIYAIGMGTPTVYGHHTGSNDVTYDLQGGTLVS